MSANYHRLFVTGVALLCAVLMAVWNMGCGTQDSASPPAVSSPAPGGGGNVPDPDPDTGAPTITLGDPSPATITAGSSGAVLQVTLLDADGAPLVGKTVTFTVAPSTVAGLDQTTKTTAANGQATVTVSGKRAGQVSVKATYSGYSTSAKTVTVLAPAIAVAAADAAITVSSPGAGGTVVTATVTDTLTTAGIDGLTVVFTTTRGELTAVSAAGDGQYQATLTSTEAGTALVSAMVAGVTSATEEIDISAGAVDSLTMVASTNKIPPDGRTQSIITINAVDGFDNPLEETIGLRTNLGVLSATQLALDNGTGTVVFTSQAEGVARVFASVGGVDIAFVDIAVELSLAGEPASIQIQVSAEEITVKGSGGTESATITARVVDLDGNPVVDSGSNLEMVITDGPRGGENLSGNKLLGQVLTLTTSGGVASANLHSGTLPGTVQVEVRVTKDRRGNELSTPLVAVVPRITVRSGPPASLFLSQSNAISSPGLAGNGSITHDYLAYVNDRWGNAVPDGTIVFFGQFLNVVQECRNRHVFDPDHPDAVDGFVEEPCIGAATGTLTPSSDPVNAPGTTFTSAVGRFADRGIVPGDTLVLLTENNPKGYGGYRIRDVISNTTLRLDVDLEEAESGLEWAVGNNTNLGGGVFTTEGAAATAGGVARWSNTYAGELVNDPTYIHAETEGGVQGHARLYHLSWAADEAFTQFSGLETGDEISGGLTFRFGLTLEDASGPTPYAITNRLVSVSATGGALAEYTHVAAPQYDGRTYNDGSLLIASTARSVLQGYVGGDVAFRWTAPSGGAADEDYDIIVSSGAARTKITITVLAGPAAP